MNNAHTITTLTNKGQIAGGTGGPGGFSGAGGAGVINNKGATIGSLINASTGSISGGSSGGGVSGDFGPGGAGVRNGGTITSLTNRPPSAAARRSELGAGPASKTRGQSQR